MERIWVSPWLVLWLATVLTCFSNLMGVASALSSGFEENFKVMGSEDHLKTSDDGQVWHLFLDEKAGCGFQTKHRYRFGWFSMKLKLVGGDSAGVVTAYYMCSDLGAGPERDELDLEFLGNRSGQPYTLQTNVYVSGVGGREMRHMLWFDPTQDYHTYSILWNNHQIVFFVDKVPIRVYRNNGKPNNFFPNKKPMYMFSSIWNADDWATRGGIEKTDWKKAPFISSYKKFKADGCRWKQPYPECVSTTTDHWWDQYDAWTLTDNQNMDNSWVGRNLVIYDYCKDHQRYPDTPPECS
ncbi:xyloglucan endotransglucosylase/hydrolase, family GH16 [Zostera marina]|uniref:Xyloglucan endotransglucosylase/hydrolase n=1 Tax=Zostera marina TaxID=29655 RepID=A0A0K9P715_ZOSMR|nr:xyloglucan endotransglucosylase/hydrolase, family GH16 [Zostera marina]